jgi:hypothetical protein
MRKSAPHFIPDAPANEPQVGCRWILRAQSPQMTDQSQGIGARISLGSFVFPFQVFIIPNKYRDLAPSAWNINFFVQVSESTVRGRFTLKEGELYPFGFNDFPPRGEDVIVEGRSIRRPALTSCFVIR